MRPHPDLDRLEAYLEGNLSEEEVLAVERLLKTEPEAADALLRLAREEAILTEWARSTHATERVCAEPAACGAAQPRSRSRVAALLALAATFIVSAAAYWLAGLGRPPAPPTQPDILAALARLEEVQGEVYIVTDAGQRPAASGQDLYAGQKLHTGGEGSSAVVRYPDTTRLELDSNTTLRLLTQGRDGSAGKKVYLEQGVLTAKVARQPDGRPMVLATSHGEVLAQETTVNFASLADLTRIESEMGQFRLRKGARSVDVHPGWYAVAVPDADFVLRPVPPRLTSPHTTLKDGTGPVLGVVFSPQGCLVASAGWDGNVRLWEPATGQLLHVFALGTRQVKSVAFSPDGTLLAAGGEDKLVRVWDVATGDEIVTLRPFRSRVNGVAFAPDGKALATCSWGARETQGEVRLWDPVTGQERGLLRAHTKDVLAVAFSPDGHTLATASADGLVKLWDTATLQERCALRGHNREVQALAFTPDGKVLASGSKDTVVKLWETATGQELATLPAHTGDVRCLAFAPDGKTLATAGGGTAVNLWDVTGGQERISFKAHKQSVCGVAFAPDGQTLATCGGDRTVKLWDATDDDVVVIPPEEKTGNPDGSQGS